MARHERKINLNTADMEELEKVSGLGHTRAQYIFEHRPYKNWEDVKKVPGFNEQLIHTMQRDSTIE
ncbi:MAG: helix-hairpin-helix domain-containing protein [Fibrobacter sp.]|nr:helix-hairpin-helix domain-containing protein [Fibrobacter sp.]